MAELVAIIYLRVSTEEQTKGLSIQEQRRECRTKAESLAREAGAELAVIEFEDHASGELLERPGLEAAREFIRENRVDLFVCLDPDRFSRNLLLQLLVTREIEGRGTRLVFVQHNYERTPEGQFFYALRGAVAEFEKAKIQERTARGRRGALAAGRFANAVAAFGYRWDKQAKAPVPDTRDGDNLAGQLLWARQIWSWALAGENPQEIAGRLNDMGVSGPQGGEWYRMTVLRLLRNPIYTGRVVVNKWDFRGVTPLKGLPPEKRSGKLTGRQRVPAEWVELPVPQLAIVTPEEFEHVQEMLDRRKRLSQRGAGLLSGLVVCGLCGSPMHYAPARPGGPYIVRCPRRHPGARLQWSRERRGQPACTMPAQMVRHFEERVWARVRRWITDVAALPEELPTDPDLHAHQPPAEAAMLERSLADRKAEYRRLFSLVRKGLAPPEMNAEAELSGLKAQIARIEGRLAELRQPVITAGERMAKLQQLLQRTESLGDQVAHLLDRLSLERRQFVVRELVDAVVILPGGQGRLRPRGTGLEVTL